VEPLAIIDLLQELTDALPGLVQVGILPEIDLLILERFDKALHLGIVVGIAAPAHADADARRLQQLGIRGRGLLHAAIRVMSQARPLPAKARPAYCRCN